MNRWKSERRAGPGEKTRAGSGANQIRIPRQYVSLNCAPRSTASLAYRLTLKTDLNTTQRDRLTTIGRSANNLLAIINDVLDFSKLEAGKLILESIPFLLRTSLDEVVTLLAHSAHDKGLELTLNIKKNDVPDNVIGDPLRLQQIIITNLMGSAIKFTEHGNIDVLVEQRAISNSRVPVSPDPRYRYRDS